MSKPKIIELQEEIAAIMDKFSANRFMMAQAFLQVIHRENILTGNRIRRRHREAEIIPEPMMYKGDNSRKIEWVIDVPQEWTNIVGKML